jgi:hypothetical protein
MLARGSGIRPTFPERLTLQPTSIDVTYVTSSPRPYLQGTHEHLGEVTGMAIEYSYWENKPGRFGRRRLLRGAAALGIGAGASALVGCGDDDDDAVEESPTVGIPGTSPTASVAKPKVGGTFREAVGSPPPVWDPYMNTTYPPQEIYGAVSARLLKYLADDQHGPSDLTTEPDV